MFLIECFKGVINEAVENSKIIEAIDNNQIVKFTYNHPDQELKGERSGEIYAFGQTKSGEDAISVYQLSGKTSSTIPNWKIFLTKYIDNLELIREYYRPRKGFNPNKQSNGQFTKIYHIVEF